MNSEEVKAMSHKYVANTYARYDVAIARGRGAVCYDYDGKKYIDFSSGIGVNSLGYSDPGWADAVYKQLCALQHTSNLFYTEPCALAAKALSERSGMYKVFFANSGAEANEGAIKAARKYSSEKYGPERHVIVSLLNSFHGRTMATLSATGQVAFHKHFDPFPDGFKHAPANDLRGTIDELTGSVCAVMMELVQGEGGVLPLDADYVKGVYEYCAFHDILLIIDEVQTGIGRTGAMFAYQHYNLAPDIVTAAKGLGGGLPIGAVLFGEKTQSVFGPGDHATTFGGNPAICAGIPFILNKLDAETLELVIKKGAYIKERLLSMPHVADVSGMGLMLGAALDGVSVRGVVNAGLERGVITLTAKEKLRLLPPLTITMEEIDEGLSKLECALNSI
jgi:acetylornithine/N-succinyldiaminopimelate aminotransferase